MQITIELTQEQADAIAAYNPDVAVWCQSAVNSESVSVVELFHKDQREQFADAFMKAPETIKAQIRDTLLTIKVSPLEPLSAEKVMP